LCIDARKEASMVESNGRAGAEARIRELIAEWQHAVIAKDADSLIRHYASDVVVFDVVPPASFTGSERYREHWQRWFDSMKGPISFEMNDIKVVTDGDVAFAHSVNRVVIDGQDNLVRATVGFRRIGGDWRVVHEHASVPLMMDMDPDDES
jgi:ketosteroid isomerase-like protein